MPYPPGVSAGTPNAPWNDDPAPECEDCLEVIHDIEDHADWCEHEAGPGVVSERQAYDPRNHAEEY